MPLQISTSGPLTVTSADARSIALIREAGGRVLDHTDFIHVFFPAGTQRQKVTPARKERRVYQDAPYSLYRLPGGQILMICQHRLSFDEGMQEAEHEKAR